MRKNSTTSNDIISGWYLAITTTTWATNWVYSVLNTSLDSTNKVLAVWDIVYFIIVQVGSTLPWTWLYVKAY
jgi:hypothetical protein